MSGAHPPFGCSNPAFNGSARCGCAPIDCTRTTRTALLLAVSLLCAAIGSLHASDTSPHGLEVEDDPFGFVDELSDDSGGSSGPNASRGRQPSLTDKWSSAISNDRVDLLEEMLRSSQHDNAPVSSEQLMRITASNGKDALMVAAKQGDLEFARWLVALGADVESRTITGGTPFMFAVLGDHLPVAEWLHEQSVGIDSRGSNGWSAMTIAAAKGQHELVAWLRDIGADVNNADVYRFTPLMRAVDNGHAQAAALLVAAANIDLDALDESDNTALHYAVAHDRLDLVDLLLAAGARSDIRNVDGLTAADMVGDNAKLRSRFEP